MHRKILPYIYLLGVVSVLFLAVFLFTRTAIWPAFDLSKTSSIGDTIGGISAPVIGLISAYLIYTSFLVQVEANKLLITEKNFNILFELYKELITDFDQLAYYRSFKNRETIFKGGAALHSYFSDVKNYEYATYEMKDFEQNCDYVLSSLLLLLQKISQANADEQDRLLILNKMQLFYNSYLHSFIDQVIDLSSSDYEKVRPEFIAKVKDVKNAFQKI